MIPANGAIALDTPKSDESILSIANLQLADVEIHEPLHKLSKPDPVNKPQKNITNIPKAPETDVAKAPVAEKPKEKTIPQSVKEIVQLSKIPEPVQGNLNITIPKAATESQPQKEESPVQKIDPPLKTPAFNQGPRTIPPAEIKKPVMKKAPVIPEAPGEVEREQATTEQKRIFYSEMKHRKLPIGKHQVAIMNYDADTNLLFVLETFDPAIQEFVAWIEGTTKEMASADKTTNYLPEVEEMVLAKFEGEFYRGVFTGQTKQNLYQIQFVDYGNVSFCSATDIKPFSKNLLMDIILHKVSAENLPNPMTKKAMSILSGDSPIEIEVTGKSDADVYTCKINGL